MMPSAIYELLAADEDLIEALGGDEDDIRIFEVQSLYERPLSTGYFIVINFQESQGVFGGRHIGPRTMQIWVHSPLEFDRGYGVITNILNRIDNILLPVENVTGDDGCRVTCVRRYSRSGNLTDHGFRTATRHALYGVAYDETAA